MNYTADEIRSYQFQKAGLSGYKAADVDDLLDNVARDYDEMAKQQEEFAAKIQVLADKITEYRESEDSVKFAILNAQKTGDGILKEKTAVADKYYAEKIEAADKAAAQAKETAEKLVFEAQTKAQEILDKSTMEGKSILSRAQINAKTLKRETEDKIKDELNAYEALKIAVDEFKDELFDAYKKHMTLISSIKTKNIEVEYTEEKQESDEDGQTDSATIETKEAE